MPVIVESQNLLVHVAGWASPLRHPTFNLITG